MNAPRHRLRDAAPRPLGLWLAVNALLGAVACDPDFGAMNDLADSSAIGSEDLREGRFLIHGQLVDLLYRDVEGDAVAEGDIILRDVEEGASLSPDSSRMEAGLTANPKSLWPRALVPYVIAPDLPDKGRVRRAIEHWESLTPIRFIPRTTQAGYVVFKPARSRVCSATLGYTGKRQRVLLPDACTTENVIHEIGHVVGLWHEHNRADRERHIIIRWRNIQPEGVSQFRKYPVGTTREVKRYDVQSIMHYASLHFSRNGRPTMVKLDGSRIAPATRLSKTDIAGVVQLYSSLGADISPPTTPEHFYAAVQSPTSLLLRWDDTWDNVGVVRYVVEWSDGGPYSSAETPSPPFLLEGLAPGSVLSLRLTAVDAAGNASLPTYGSLTPP